MKDKIFIDTNILVYAHDLDAGIKHDEAAETVERLWESGQGILSTQVLQELYVTLTRKIPQPLDRTVVRRMVKNYASWDVVINGPEIIILASELEEIHKISFWDAMIVASAFYGNASAILTEDLNHGQFMEGILIKNPFREK